MPNWLIKDDKDGVSSLSATPLCILQLSPKSITHDGHIPVSLIPTYTKTRQQLQYSIYFPCYLIHYFLIFAVKLKPLSRKACCSTSWPLQTYISTFLTKHTKTKHFKRARCPLMHHVSMFLGEKLL